MNRPTTFPMHRGGCDIAFIKSKTNDNNYFHIWAILFMITAICDVLKECYSRGWISTRDGNGSVRRRNENWIYITPSGTKKQRLDAESLVKMEFQADNSLLKVNMEFNGQAERWNRTSPKTFIWDYRYQNNYPCPSNLHNRSYVWPLMNKMDTPL